MTEKLKVLDLFSGIGGFSLGLERTGGFETVAFCEIDPYCQKVLAKHWPDVPCLTDIRTIDATGLGRIDCIAGGYPCQPFSHAGKRQGSEDDRHLWPAMLAVIKAIRPRWVIGENVAGHISMGLDDVLSDLEAEDYTARTFVIPACAVDAKHRRDRVWIVAHQQSIGRFERDKDAGGLSEATAGDPKQGGSSNSGKTLAHAERKRQSGPRWSLNTSYQTPNTEGEVDRTEYDVGWLPQSRLGGMVDGLSRKLDGNLDVEKEHDTNEGTTSDARFDCVRTVRGDGQAGKASSRLFETGCVRSTLPTMPHKSGSAGRPSEGETAKTLQGLRQDVSAESHKKTQHMQQGVPFGNRQTERYEAMAWPAESAGIPRVATGVPHRTHRLRGLGNAVVPQIPELIGHAILQAESTQ